jgi:hypothetical protein
VENCVQKKEGFSYVPSYIQHSKQVSMSPQIASNNKLRILKNQEVKYITEIMTMFMGFLVLPCIFLNVDEMNQDLEMVHYRSAIFVTHIQGFHDQMDLCSWHNP